MRKHIKQLNKAKKAMEHERKEHKFSYDKFVRSNRQGCGCMLTTAWFGISIISFLIFLTQSTVLAIIVLVMEIGMYMILNKTIRWIMKWNDERYY